MSVKNRLVKRVCAHEGNLYVKSCKRYPKNVPKNVPEELTGIKKRIYDLIQADPSVSRTQIAFECGMSVKTIGRHLAGMEKFVKHVGPARGGHWEIVTPASRK